MGKPSDTSDSLLRIQGLDKFFGGLHAVDSVSFEVRPGIIKAVIGPNGAGNPARDVGLRLGKKPLGSGPLHTLHFTPVESRGQTPRPCNQRMPSP